MGVHKLLAMFKKTRLLFALIPVLALTWSCEEDIPSYPFRVIAVNEEGARIQNAKVVADVPLPNVSITYTGYTGIDGVATFVHEGDGEAVLQVRVTKGTSTEPAVAGCGYIKLEPDEEVTVRIVLEEYLPNDPGC